MERSLTPALARNRGARLEALDPRGPEEALALTTSCQRAEEAAWYIQPIQQKTALAKEGVRLDTRSRGS